MLTRHCPKHWRARGQEASRTVLPYACFWLELNCWVTCDANKKELKQMPCRSAFLLFDTFTRLID